VAEKNSLTYENVTAEQFARLAEEARRQGIAFDAAVGKAEKFGAEVVWEYVASAGSLTIACSRAPFFFSPQAVLAQIDPMVRKVLG
jgi:hypothetical protein